jgi:hypothetical protein
MPDDVNDDTTSGEPSDEDDGRDELSADDDWHVPIVVGLYEVALDLIAPESGPSTPYIAALTPGFVTSKRLRC